MEELDPIIRDLGASALRPQESYSCTSHALNLKCKHMGLIIILILVLLLASQQTLLWPKVLTQLLTITVSAPFISNIEKRSK